LNLLIEEGSKLHVKIDQLELIEEIIKEMNKTILKTKNLLYDDSSPKITLSDIEDHIEDIEED